MRILHQFIFTLIFLSNLQGQDFTWWNQAHQWDGYTSWQKYLIMSPGFLGPNALPIPESTQGQIPRSSIGISYDHYYATDDITNSFRLDATVRLFSDRVAMQLSWIPWEGYNYSSEIRDLRASRDFDGMGSSSGDLYVGTQIQLIKNHQSLPDIVLSFTFRTASGTNLRAARFTDTPGYYFDVSAGRDFRLSQSNTTVLRPFVQAGFYVWQTYLDLHRQNDALLYGFGAELAVSKITLKSSLRGYHGYLNNGDRPLVWLTRCNLDWSENRSIFLHYERGLHDFPFSRIGVGGRFYW